MTFKSWHKTPFWSQFVFGLIAMFALPEIQTIPSNTNESHTALMLRVDSLPTLSLEQQSPRLFNAQQTQQQIQLTPQAVNVVAFFAKAYHFDGDFNHPIRAGPQIV